MLVEESVWIKETIHQFLTRENFPLLNIGSSTETFRKATQPHIHSNVFHPVQEKGFTVYHTDIKQDEGVDIVGNLNDLSFREKLRERKINSVLCSNLLEHLENPKLIADSILNLLNPGGFIIVTVPYTYPYHKDPIDTLFRPGVERLHSLFPGTEIIESAIVASEDSFKKDLLTNKKYMMIMIARWMMPFYKFSDWKHMINDLFTMNMKYSATCLLLQKK